MQEERATEADLTPGPPREIECPVLQNGKRLVVVIQPVDVGLVIASFEGLPTIPLPPDPAATPKASTAADRAREFAVMREIARHGIVAPTFTFGDAPEPGKPWWGVLRPDNRSAVAAGIMELSGVMVAGGPLETFPDERAGAAAGAGAVGAGEAAAESEPGLAEAQG